MRSIRPATLVILAALGLALGQVERATRAASPLPNMIPTPVSVPVFGLIPRAFLPIVSNSTSSATLPPGSRLPSEAECAARVQPKPENKRMNTSYNMTMGNHPLASNFFGGSDPRANTEIVPRVTGHFTGTTDMILQWAACKWGIDVDIVRAQAAIESWWRQNARGDWGILDHRCPPAHGLGADDPIHHPDECPESWGLFQIRYPYHASAWPDLADSSAFNADTAFAIWRACYEGYEGWLNQIDKGAEYRPGDVWGCVGRFYAGRWRTPEAEYYIGRVRSYLNARIWETPGFQEP